MICRVRNGLNASRVFGFAFRTSAAAEGFAINLSAWLPPLLSFSPTSTTNAKTIGPTVHGVYSIHFLKRSSVRHHTA